MSVVWVTSFNEKLIDSGNKVTKSFIKSGTEGLLWTGLENVGINPLEYCYGKNKIINNDITYEPILTRWLEENKDIIPVELGGAYTGEGLPWFRKHASRWFRKIVCLDKLFESPDPIGDTNHVIWIDADCEFTGKITTAFVEDILFDENRADIFYMRGIRPVIEAGVFGLNIKPGKLGRDIFSRLINLYITGAFRGLKRWDDSFLIQHILEQGLCLEHDIVKTNKTGPHASVIEYSLLKDHVIHNKGTHGRIKRIYK